MKDSVIKELLEALGCSISPEVILEHLQNNPNYGNGVYTSKQSYEHAVKLSHKAANPKVFMKKFEELKSKNTDSLNQLVSLLYCILADERKYRSPGVKPKTAPKPVITDKLYLTKEDLPQIKNKIQKAVGDEMKGDGRKLEENMKGRSDIPTLPSWLLERTALSWDFPRETYAISASIAAIPKVSQEAILIDDLLYILEGVPGKYIVPMPTSTPYGPRYFEVSKEVDKALSHIIQQILPLASHYSIVRRFIESSHLGSGKVIHALVYAMEILLKDYYIVIAQLETEHMAGTLNLQKLWYFVRPIMHTMDILSNISSTIGKSNARSGAVLSLLHEQTNALLGDTKAQDVCLFLTQKASQPYMQILYQWIYKGSIEDPFQEFLVEDNEVIKKEDLPLDYSADYWEKRYTIQRDRSPKFLSRLADIILRTGKYLNVISQCGKSITLSDAEEIKYTLREQHYVTAIQRAYSFASKSLLELLMKEYDFMGRLKSVKHYFLMDQGDFIVQFMDASEQELNKNIDDIIPTRLESLLGLCLRLSAANHDQYNEDMRTELLPYDLQFQMSKILSIQTQEEKDYRHHKDDKLPLTGWESFSFGIDVKWPVSLILNRKAVACYQMIFRHLFYCKHVERMLCRVWLCNKVAKRFSEARQYGAAFALRQRMLSCLQNLQYYMCVEVIEPNWSIFIASLNKVTNVDEVLEKHSDFLEACLEDCMLTSPPLLTQLTKLCQICVQFCQFFQEMRKYFVDAELTGMIGSAYEATESLEGVDVSHADPMSKSTDSAGPPGDSFEQSIARYDLCFTSYLLKLLSMINDLAKDNNTKKLVNIMYRLNFNTFYSEQLDRLCMENSMRQSQERSEGVSK